jgi:predicted glycoside hydrolase/deacetylase ChbG (UPF0249 family)/glycosyltransferase involved in cell wall biosynthesis
MAQTLTIACHPRQLIINADDLGISAERDAGIFQLFACGAISSASLLVDGAHATSAAAQAVGANLPLGLHLNLTEGQRAQKNSLTDAGGNLRGKLGLRDAFAASAINADDLARDIRRQFDAFIALTGELPSHVDGHQHAHVEPLVANVLAPIMAHEYGVYCVRLPRQKGLDSVQGDAEFEAAFQRAVVRTALAAQPFFADCGIYSTTTFLGQSFMGGRLQAPPLTAALSSLIEEYRPTGATPLSVELMVHPGLPATDPVYCAFCRSPARAHEMAVLQSDEWRAAIAGWQLSSYRALPRPQANGASSPRVSDADRPTIVLYGKLTPATGNAETARRYAAAGAAIANVRFRPLAADTEKPQPLARETLRLRELAARETLDLALGIHLYRAGAPLAAAFATPDAPPLPYGLLASGTDANADVDDPARAAAMASALETADFLLCLNEAQKPRLREFRLPTDTTVLGNGIDIGTPSSYSLRQALGLANNAKLILFPAGIRRLKGVLPLIEALAAPLASNYSTHVLVVLGPVLEHDYAAAIHTRIAALQAEQPGLRGRIVLHDGLPHADYLAALGEAALVLNASEHEGLSHGLMEAMGAGIPVLARDIPGNRLLVRDGENGRLFASFAELPAAYAACFSSPAATAQMAERACDEIARKYSAATEAATLQAVLERCLKRHQAPLELVHVTNGIGIGVHLRLELAAGTHPMSAENVALFRHLALSPAAERHLPQEIELAVDVGCGCGVFGFLLLDTLAAGGKTLQQMLFTDTHLPSLSALSRTLIRHRQQLSVLASATLADGNLLAPLRQLGKKAQLICANLPQTPGPATLATCRPDRCGGSDGADLICALIEQLPTLLANGGETFMLHISLANPARVARTLAANGLSATVLAEQPRRTLMADYEAMLPGLPAYLLDEHAAGRAEFSLQAGAIESIQYHARLLRISRCR